MSTWQERQRWFTLLGLAGLCSAGHCMIQLIWRREWDFVSSLDFCGLTLTDVTELWCDCRPTSVQSHCWWAATENNQENSRAKTWRSVAPGPVLSRTKLGDSAWLYLFIRPLVWAAQNPVERTQTHFSCSLLVHLFLLWFDSQESGFSEVSEEVNSGKLEEGIQGYAHWNFYRHCQIAVHKLCSQPASHTQFEDCVPTSSSIQNHQTFWSYSNRQVKTVKPCAFSFHSSWL